MPDVRKVFRDIRSPKGDDDPGQVTIGYYTLTDGLMTMTDGNGKPIRKDNGELWTHRMRDGDKETPIAHWMTGKVYRALRGDDVLGFNRRISYPRHGIA